MHFVLAFRIVRAEFLALVLVSLMVLHKAEGVEMEDAMKEVAKRAQATGDDQLAAQVCVFIVVVSLHHHNCGIVAHDGSSKHFQVRGIAPEAVPI